MSSMIRCLCFILLLCHSYVSAQSVTVSIVPGHQTVKVKSGGAAEVIGINAVKYSLTGIFDPMSLETTEHKPGTATWTCSLDSAVFMPPAGVPPAPVPGPSISAPAAIAGKPSIWASTWTSTVTSVNAGQWEITYKVTVSYVKIRKKDNQADGTFGPFTGTGTCTFKATEGNFRVEIKPEDDFIGNRNTLGIGEPAKVILSKWDSNDPVVVFVSMSASGKNSAIPPTDTLVNINDASFEAGEYAGSSTLTVNATVGGVPATETIDVSVLEPSGAGIIQTPGTFKWHVKDTASIGFKGTSYYLPDTVSFWKVGFKEGGGTATATGYLKDRGLDGMSHKIGTTWLSVRKGIDPSTKKINTEISKDTISQGPFTDRPYADGTFRFPIDWLYKMGTHEGKVTIMVSTSSVNTDGDMVRSKGGTTNLQRAEMDILHTAMDLTNSTTRYEQMTTTN